MSKKKQTPPGPCLNMDDIPKEAFIEAQKRLDARTDTEKLVDKIFMDRCTTGITEREKALTDHITLSEFAEYDRKAKTQGARTTGGKASGQSRREQTEALQEEWLDIAHAARQRNPKLSIPQIAERICADMEAVASDYGFNVIRKPRTIIEYLRKNLK